MSPLSIRRSVLASPRSSALSTADSRSERDIPNFVIILSSMKSSSKTQSCSLNPSFSLAAARMQTLKKFRKVSSLTSSQTVGSR